MNIDRQVSRKPVYFVQAKTEYGLHTGVDCPRNTSTLNNVTKVPCFGGYSRILSRANQIRAQRPDTLFLNAGDEFQVRKTLSPSLHALLTSYQGTAFYSFYGGEKIAATLNQLNMTAFTLGNHEFDGGDDFLARFLQNLTMPTISTNVKTNNTALAARLQPYLIVPEHNLAIVAVTTNTTRGISSPGPGTTFEPYVSSLQPTVDGLLQSRLGPGNGLVKRVVALTHIGYDEDIALAKSTRNIGLIIGGHSHTRLGNDSAAAGAYPTIVKNLDGEDVFVVTAWRWGQQLGQIQVTYEETTGRILAYTGAPINMTEDVPQSRESPPRPCSVLLMYSPLQSLQIRHYKIKLSAGGPPSMHSTSK